jgi:SAM-dependent methyltransferase
MNELPLASGQFYDLLAEVYDAELEGRAPWVLGVEDLVVQWCRTRGSRSLIDVGCGNGRRLERLLRATGLGGAAIDVSPAMVEHARRRGIEAFVVDISSSPFDPSELRGRKFDLIICLWSVFGYVRGHEGRRRALQNMRSLMAPGGAIILDVNNRYNLAHYGWRAVVRNMILDGVRSKKTGDFTVRRKDANGRAIQTLVHIFSRREVVALCRQAGLAPVEFRYLDYDTGEPRTQWSGQMCVLIEERT